MRKLVHGLWKKNWICIYLRKCIYTNKNLFSYLTVTCMLLGTLLVDRSMVKERSVGTPPPLRWITGKQLKAFSSNRLNNRKDQRILMMNCDEKWNLIIFYYLIVGISFVGNCFVWRRKKIMTVWYNWNRNIFPCSTYVLFC